MKRFLIGLCMLLCSAGCSTKVQYTAEQLAQQYSFNKHIYRTAFFDLVGYAKGYGGKQLVVYIEGDGRAWVTRTRPSFDPTPKPPLAFALAAQDPSPNVLYLARPCQYTQENLCNRNCVTAFWTSARMGEHVIAAIDAAIDTAKKQTGATAIDLVGYSGGGGVALLVASRRDDVVRIRTVAGNLNTDLWVALHGISPLKDSLNPVSVAPLLTTIPQMHYIGSDDRIIPQEIALSYKMAAPSSLVRLKVVSQTTHYSGWVHAWKELVQGRE
ncbi:MAG: hypothetical protein MI749_20075 [Desulfovibrionales bacterium]|nr:hypothetical protein [Desulfovibrionales bacterium]